MKKYLSLILFIFTISIFSSCDNKSCQEVVCPQNQFCVGGNCVCKDGFEGDNCTVIAAEKYVGDYNISKACQQGNGPFDIYSFGSIQTDSDPLNELLFFNFLGTGLTAYAYIATDVNGRGNYLRFPSQTLGATEIVGEGFYEEYSSYGRLRVELQITSNNQLSNCTYTFY